MGMFDYLTCEHPLPDGSVASAPREWQTKDLFRHLDCARLTANGRLILKEPNGGAEYEYPHHGELRFYRGIGLNPKTYQTEGWEEYMAHFDHGQLTRIDLVFKGTNQEYWKFMDWEATHQEADK